MRILIGVVLTVAASALVAACANGSAQTAPTQSIVVDIITQIDFSEEPFNGTFEVTEGADALGCSSGTFVDTPPESPTDRGIYKEFTCESGARSGTFTAEFFPPGGPWKIVEAADEFGELSGWGAFVLLPPSDPDDPESTVGVERLIGEIRFDS